MTATRIDDRTVELSNEDKVFFPDAGITKGQLVTYHRRIADRMLPYLVDRPLVLRRFPDGIGSSGFFQKDTPAHYPEWIERCAVPKRSGGTVDHVLANDEATLAFLVNQGAVELHTLLAPAARPDHPDQLILDLDPSTDDPADVVLAARAVRAVLDDLDVTSYVKSSGSRGVHVVIALDGSATFARSREVSRCLADAVVERDPDRLTTAHAKADRGDRLFVDFLRNGYAQHAVVPYGVRALPGAPVAAPLDWDEATSADFDPRRYTITNIFRRLGQKDDPWAEFGGRTYSLDDLAGRASGG